MKIVTLGALVLGLGWPLCATSSPEEADRLFQASDWEKAASAYEELLRADPSDGFYWFRLGVAKQSLKQLDAAYGAYEKARIARYKSAATYIRGTIVLDQLGRRDEAVRWLDAYLQEGGSAAIVRSVPALQPLAGDARVQQLLAQRGDACGGPKFRALDFWVGDFEVQTPQGQKAGSNRIEKILGGCVLLESWTSVTGGSGKSFSWFDQDSGQWRQLYHDTTGHPHEYAGNVKGDSIEMVHTRVRDDGSRQMLRMTFSPLKEGKVRQFIEESWDGGRHWSVWFEGIYVPVK